ncbi:MAG: putative glycoside hydrolase, partial [Patescibacteria group bacterium]
MLRKINKKKVLLFAGIPVLFLFLIGSFLGNGSGIKYFATGSSVKGDSVEEKKEKIFVPTHIAVPEVVKGIYMTSCVASMPSWREKLVKIADETEINSIIIDIKDYTGTISFKSDNSLLETGGKGCVVSDMAEFVDSLHKKNIYAIARITVFQDPYYTNKRPDMAIKKASDKTIWKDRKGLSFIDVGAKEYWDYIVALAEESYTKIGFDELNFDYIRFPSDGDMKNIYYTFSNDREKADVLKDFFSYLHDKLEGTGVIMSADLFGMTTTNKDDLNIGQILEYAEPYFDYIAPMVYPSHYPSGFKNYKNVNAHPYEIVKFSMDEASKRLIAASSTPDKLRPWLQDFDYPVTYTADMVRKQKQAVYDAGLSSWMLWDPANK